MRYLLMHALLLIGGFTSAQNLVPNSSFEEYYVCPDNTSQVDSSVSWHSVLNTPDYFVTCSPYPVCIPDNLCGYQYPFDGNAYMGIITYDWYFTYWKEIIGTQLLDTLVPGNNYHFSMRVSRGNWTNQSYNCSASNNIGVRFTTKPYSASFPPPINNTATLNTDTIVKDTLNWILLSWNFTADSAYNYIYIGNFFDNAHTDTVVINAPNGQFGIAYYFIDSINLFCNDPDCITSVDVIQNDGMSIFYQTESRTLKVNAIRNEIVFISLFNSVGQIVKQIQLNDSVILNVSELPNGIYITEIRTSNQVFSQKIFIH